MDALPGLYIILFLNFEVQADQTDALAFSEESYRERREVSHGQAHAV
jgi:hypothetical protein